MKQASHGSSTSVSLIERARCMDPDAWERLCYVYGPLVYRWGRRAGLQDSDAADIGQEVFRTVAGRIGGFDHRPHVGTFRGWLRMITRNKIGDHLRRAGDAPHVLGGSTARQRWADLVDPVAEALSDSSVAAPDDQNLLFHRALDLLRGEFEVNTWRAFWLSAVEERPTDEIAETLGLTRQAVRQAKYRVLRRLRVELGAEACSE